MSNIEPLVAEFLAQKRIAVAGVSRGGKATANFIYTKLKDAGYEALAVNPSTGEIDGAPCYPDLTSIPGTVDGVVIATRASRSAEIVRQCIEAGVPRVWMHCSLGSTHRASIKWAAKFTSVSEEAVKLCRENGIAVITGACPMMYVEPVDPAHAIIKRLIGLFGGLRSWK
jgi:predicted CoA-binding protein